MNLANITAGIYKFPFIFYMNESSHLSERRHAKSQDSGASFKKT